MRLLLAFSLLIIGACAQRDPMGIWISGDLILELEPSWSGDRFALVGDDWSIQGTYAIEGDRITFTAMWGELALSWEYPFELGDDTLTIGGIVFRRRR